MTVVALRKILFAIAALAAFSLAVPAAAQLYSEGYQFLQAVKDRDGEKATEMLNTPGSTVVNARDLSSGETGLHYTVQRRDLTWTRWLLQEGANPNIADSTGRTPLAHAAQLNFLQGVEALVAGGARVDITNQTGETPLINAVHARNVELVEVLLRAGADPDRADNTGRSARDYANERGANERVLAAIAANDAARGDQGPAQVYGPDF